MVLKIDGRRSIKYGIVIAGLLLLLYWSSVQGIHAQADENKPLGEVMSEILDSMAYLVPLSFHASIWDDLPADDEAKKKLDNLVQSAKLMDKHAELGELEKHALSRSFTDTVIIAQEAFESDSSAWAWFAMQDLIEHCAACHAQQSTQISVRIGENLTDQIDMDSLERYQQSQIYVATRQFDKALLTLEADLMDPAVTPVQSELTGTYAEYLDIIMSEGADYERATDLLNTVASREDTPYFLQRRIAVWLESLQSLAEHTATPSNYAGAKKLYDRASELNAIPGMGDGVVLDLAASRMLRQFVADNSNLTKSELAQAYFTLALIEMRNIQTRTAVPEMELLLQATIQADPLGPLAKTAYALLEEFGVNAREEGMDPITLRPSLIDLAALRQSIGL